MSAAAAPDRSTLAAWVARDAVPMAGATGADLTTAVDALMADLGGDVELLGFGEGLHGGEAILQFRNRLFEHLVAAHGFSAIAVESHALRGRAVNAFVHGNGPDAYEAIRTAGFSHGFGDFEANRELVAWMRQHNAGVASTDALRFYGFDSPTEMFGTDGPRQAVRLVLDYLAGVEPEQANARLDRIEPLLGSDAAWENPAAMMDPAQSIGLSPAAAALRLEVEELDTTLSIQRPGFIARSGPDAYRQARHDAAVARRLLTYHAGLARATESRISDLLGLRDAMMADTLAYIADCERGRGRVLVFAHNRHLQRGLARWQLGPYANAWWPAGAQVQAAMGRRYAVIGSGVALSAANGIAEPEPGTIEAVVARPGSAVVLIPTHGGRGLPAAEIAELPTRSGSARNSTFMPLGPESFTDFDWLAIFSSTDYARGGPTLP